MFKSETIYKRNAGWVSQSDASYQAGFNSKLFSWLYTPDSAISQSTGFILCAPVGHEYIHTHRAYRHFAEMLAMHGFPCLRFDYSGVGDSADYAEADIFCQWVEDINQQAYWLKNTIGVKHIVFLGLGFAANMVCVAAEKHGDNCSVILWEPYETARSFKRKLGVLAGVSEFKQETEAGYIESAGYAYSEQSLIGLEKFDLSARNLSNIKICVVVEAQDNRDKNSRWLGKLGLEDKVKRIYRPDFTKMLDEPHKTSIPFDVFGEIIALFKVEAQAQPVTLPSLPNLEPTLQAPHYIENIYRSDDRLFGVLTTPVNGDKSKPLIILTNAGAAHHVGPSEIYVKLARYLAEHGWCTLRYDLGNLGDSCTGCPENENFPYAESSLDELEEVIDHFSEDFSSCILAGLCSGAYISFREGLKNNSNVSRVVLVNPLTFEWIDGMSLDVPSPKMQSKEASYYSAALKDKSRWGRLLKGQVSYKSIAVFAVKYTYQKVSHIMHDLCLAMGLAKPNKLQAELLHYANSKTALRFVFSDSDPGFKMLTDDAGSIAAQMIAQKKIKIYFVENADHTFSYKKMQSNFCAKFLAALLD